MTENIDHKHKSNISIVIRALIATSILVAAVLLAYTLIKNPAHTEKKTDMGHSQTVVKTTKITLGDYPVKIEVMGQVIPARSTLLKARVSGEIINVSKNFIPGGFFKKSENILKIDPADYDLEVKMKTAALKQSQASYRLEQGQQQIAKDEMKILQRSSGKKLKSTDLALRKPQLEQAKAILDSAQTDLEIAQLNLERTNIKSPFNAVMINRLTDIGNIISPQDGLATLISTDEYWIDIEVPIHHIRWLDIPAYQGEKGSQAIIMLDGGRGKRDGALLKQTGTLDERSRLANMIVSVSDPLLLNTKKQNTFPLVLGDFVPVTLIGKTLKNSVRLPLNYIREGGTIWLEQNRKLVIQPVIIAYKDRKYAYIVKGLKQSSNIITSNIITPFNGMDVMIQSSNKTVTGKE